MSATIVSNVLKHSAQKSTKRLLMVILAGEANSAGVAQPKVDDLAAFANVDSRRISTHIGGLEKANELFVFRREGLHNVYIVLPGLNVEQREQAIKFVNTQFKPDELLTLDDLPLTEPSGGTPDDSSRGDGISGGREPLTEPSGEPLTDSSSPPDGSVSGYNKDSVVVESESDPDLPVQQQQQPPTPQPQRDPTALEVQIFDDLHIGEAIWQNWMQHEPVDVIAAFYHVTKSEDVESELALMRSMLDHGKGAPKRRYIEDAQKAIERGSLEPAEQDNQQSLDDPDGDEAWMNERGLTPDQREHFGRLRSMVGSVNARDQFEQEVTTS